MDAVDGGTDGTSTSTTGSHHIVLDEPKRITRRRFITVAVLCGIIGIFLVVLSYAIVTSLNRDHDLQMQICINQKVDHAVDEAIAKKVNIEIHRNDIPEGC